MRSSMIKEYKILVIIICAIIAGFIILLQLSINAHENTSSSKKENYEKLTLKSNMDSAKAVISDSKPAKRQEEAPKDETFNDDESVYKSVYDGSAPDSPEDFYREYLSFKERGDLIDRSFDKDHSQIEDLNEESAQLIEPKDNAAYNDTDENSSRSDLIKAMQSKTRVTLGFGSAFAQDSNTGSDNNEKGSKNGTLKAYEEFERDDFSLGHKVQSLKNPFTLFSGTFIRAVLITSVNSDLPGQLSAMVTSDVYDSIKGEYLLIPKGSKLIGQYASNASFGAERLFLGFSRLIFPDGSTLNLGAMPGSASDGSAGFEAETDNHYMRTILNCLLLSTVTAASNSVNRSQSYYDSETGTKTVFASAASERISDAISRIIQRDLNLSPTLHVKSGYAFTITLTHDIEFKGSYRR